jgi:mannan endo-1,4-beta-mannosidase
MKKTRFFCCVFLILIFIACKKNKTSVEIPHDFSISYSVFENKIYHFNTPIQFIGVNSFHSFAASSSNDMKAWTIDIVREFVGNVKENPITGYPIQDANGAYLHSLQSIVDSNRINKKITILCPFGWDGNGPQFTGLRPTQTSYYNAFKIKLQQWATQFKTQPDVWLELWNEPYRYDRQDGYTDDIWLNDMKELLSVIRNAGNPNIVLIPCAEQGQDESVLLNKGLNLLSNNSNILYDIHAYEKWLRVTNNNMGSRLVQLQLKKIPIFFGEVAPLNSSSLMNTQPFLDSIYNKGISVSAWVWKYDSNDADALLNDIGLPNNNNNKNWGSTFINLCTRVRRP